MTRASLRACAFGTLMATVGCELIVPSDRELTGGGPSANDAGNVPDAADGGAPPVEGGTDGASEALVQQTVIAKTATRSADLILATPPRSGSALVVTVGTYEAGTTAKPIITLSGGGATWSLASKTSVHFVTQVFVGVPVAPGTTSTTVNISTSSTQTELVAHLSEWAGVTALGASGTNDDTTTPVVTRVLPTADRVALVYASAVTSGVPLGAPANAFVDLQRVASSKLQIVDAYRLDPPAGSTYGTSWSEATPSQHSWDANIITLLR